MRIEICGTLGTGKSTLAGKLAEHANWMLVKEPVETNPFLEAFYGDREKFGIENALFFAATYIHHVKKYEHINTIYDASDILNRAYIGLKTLSPSDAAVYAALDMAVDALPPPDLILHLVYPADKTVARVNKRGRDFEAGVTVQFVEALQAQIEKQVALVRASGKTPVLALDMEEFDIIKRPEDIQRVWQKIHETLAANKDAAPKSNLKKSFGGPKL